MTFRWPIVVVVFLAAIVFMTDTLGLLSFPSSTDFTSDACVGAGVLAVLYSVAGGRAVRETAEAPAGQCQQCGYDLRATPDRCPECGTSACRDTHEA